MVYKYIPDDDFIESYIDKELTLKDFYGTIEVYDFYEYVNAHEEDKASYNSALPGLAPCNSIQINTPGLNGGDNSGNNGSSCTITTYVTTCWCKNELVGEHDHQATTITYVINCSGDSSVSDTYQKSSYNPTGCGGGSDNNTNPIGINQPEVVPCLDDSNCYVDYINNVLSQLPNLTQEQADWIADFDNIQKVVQLSDFLDENDSPEAINFAKEAVNALMAKGDVNLDKELIISNTVPECVKTVINKLINDNAYVSLLNLPDFVKNELNLVGNIFDVFNNSNEYHLNFKVANLPPNSQGQDRNATTNYNSSTKGFDVILNSDYVENATDLAISRTIIHESLHAYISLIYHTQPFSNLRQSMSYLLSTNGNNENSAQHILMTKQFLEGIAKSLETWDNSSLSNNNYYKYLSWSRGMLSTPAFNSLSTAMKNNIISANINEGQANQSANSSAQGIKNCN